MVQQVGGLGGAVLRIPCYRGEGDFDALLAHFLSDPRRARLE